MIRPGVNGVTKDNFEAWYDYLTGKFPELSVTDAVKAATQLTIASYQQQIMYNGIDVSVSQL